MFQLYLICSENWFEACSVGKLKMYGEAMSRNTQIQKISSHTDPVFHPDSKSCLGNEIEAMSQKLLTKCPLFGKKFYRLPKTHS